MLERYDQSELLGLIEGDLDARSAAALRSRLAKDPLVASMVDAMILDRSELRAFEEPVPPQDFLVDIEPMLSRPMLYEPVAEIVVTKPGEFRRQQQRRARRTRWGRLAVAAALLLAATGGGWALIQSFSGDGFNHTNEMLASGPAGPVDHSDVARNSPPRADGSAHSALTNATRDELGPGPVHHNRPPRHILSDSTPALASAQPNATKSVNAPIANEAAAGPMIVAADFAVVMQTPNATVAESAVSGVIADLGDRASLVRNFSYAEAQKLNEQYRLAHGGSTRRGADAPPAVALAPGMAEVRETSITRSELFALARNVREQLQSNGVAGESSASQASTRGSTIAGAAKLAPTLEQQLDFSSRGATYTLAVPASEVVALLERLALNDATGNVAVMLRMLPVNAADADNRREAKSDAKASEASPPTLDWLTEGPMVRQAMQRLEQARDDSIVLVPVMVR